MPTDADLTAPPGRHEDLPAVAELFTSRLARGAAAMPPGVAPDDDVRRLDPGLGPADAATSGSPSPTARSSASRR